MLQQPVLACVHWAPPCGTFSRARKIRRPGAPPPLRNRDHIRGFPHLQGTHHGRVRSSKALVELMAAQCRVSSERGICWAVKGSQVPASCGKAISAPRKPFSQWSLQTHGFDVGVQQLLCQERHQRNAFTQCYASSWRGPSQSPSQTCKLEDSLDSVSHSGLGWFRFGPISHDARNTHTHCSTSMFKEHCTRLFEHGAWQPTFRGRA